MSQSHKVGANCRLTKRLMRESWKVRYPQGFEKLHQLPGDLEGYAGAQGCVHAQEGPGSHVWPRISRKRRLRSSARCVGACPNRCAEPLAKIGRLLIGNLSPVSN